MPEDLAHAVNAALEDEADTDLDALFKRLAAAIAAAPQDRALRELRLRLSEGFGHASLQLEDLGALVQLNPSDLRSALALALKRQHGAYELNEPEEAGDDGEEGEAEDGAAEAQRQALEQQTLQELHALLRHPDADAAFAKELLDGWQEHLYGQDWSLLAAALRACARWPADATLQGQLAQAWASLSHRGPDFELPDGQPAVGFAVDYAGQLHDPALVRRSLETLEPLLARQPQDAELLALRAHLHLGLSRFEAAAEDFQAAAQAWQAAGEAEAAQESADWAQRCAAGRSALCDDMLGGMEHALAQLGQAPDRPPRHAAAAAFLAKSNAEMTRLRQELESELAEARPAILAGNRAPSAEQRAELEALAQTLASALEGVLPFEPLRYRQAHPRREELHPQLGAFDACMRELGFECLCWVETLDYTERFGAPTLTGVWPHPSGEATLLSTAVAALHVSELETEFSDGRQLITSQGRGRNYFGGGPQVDVLMVDASLALPEVIELHRARVAHALAANPGLRLRPWTSAADFIAAQERQRQAKLAYRLAVGQDETEARSIPVSHPEFFVPMMRQAALDFVRSAQAQRGQRQSSLH